MFHHLSRLATSARLFLEPIWLDWHQAWGSIPVIPSTHTCGRTSLFLQEVFRREGLQAQWTSGVPRLTEDGPDVGPYGFFFSHRWKSHAWVECEGWIVDITADQFGADPIIVTPVADPRYGKGDADTALPEYVLTRTKAVNAILLSWVEFRAARDFTCTTREI